MIQGNGWWSLDNCLLVHGLQGGENHDKDWKDRETPLVPKNGEIACSIVAPTFPATHSLLGVVLEPATPVFVAPKDVGSTRLDDGSRLPIHTAYKPEELPMEHLILASILAGKKNEVGIDLSETRVNGVHINSSRPLEPDPNYSWYSLHMRLLEEAQQQGLPIYNLPGPLALTLIYGDQIHELARAYVPKDEDLVRNHVDIVREVCKTGVPSDLNQLLEGNFEPIYI